MAKNSKETIVQKIISVFPPYESAPRGCYLKEIAEKLSIDSHVLLPEIEANKNIFIWLTSRKLTTVPAALKVIRLAFENNRYSPLDVELDCINSIREAFGLKSVNSNDIKTMLSAGKAKIIEYSSFTELEKKYYSIFNMAAPSDFTVPNDYYLNLFPKKNIQDAIPRIKSILAEKDRAAQMLFRKHNGETLCEIGNSEGISKERVRKLIEKPYALTKRWLYEYEKPLTDHYFGSDALIMENKIKEDIGKDRWSVIKSMITSSDSNLRFIRYETPLNIIFRDMINVNGILNSFSTMQFDTMQDYYSFVIKQLAGKGYGFLTLDNIEAFLANRHILLPTGQYSDGKINFSTVLPKILAAEFPDGIKISDDEGISKVISIASQKYGLDVGGTLSVRNVAVRIQTSCYLVNKGTYSAIAPLAIPDSLQESIINYISQSKAEFVSYNALYDHFADEFAGCGILNPYAMHGALKYHMKDSGLIITKDYVCAATKSDTTSSDRFILIKDFISQSDQPVETKTILDQFPSLTTKELYLLTLYHPQIARWDDDHYRSMSSLPLSDEEKASMLADLEAVTDNEYSYAGECALYNQIKENHPEIIEKLGIINSTQVFSIISWYADKNKYYISKPHIVKGFSGSRFSLDTLVTMYLKDKKEVNKKEAVKTLSKLCGRTSSTIVIAVTKALTEYYKTSTNSYVNPAAVKMTANNPPCGSGGILT